MEITCEKILKAFPDLITACHGAKETIVKDVRAVDDGRPDTLIFTSNPKDFETVIKSSAPAVVIPKEAWNDFIQKNLSHKTVLLSSNVPLALATVIKTFFPLPTDSKSSVHPSAVIASSAKIGKNVKILANVNIGENVSVDDDCFLGPNVVVEDECSIGKRTRLLANVFIGHGTVVGDDCEVQPNSTIGSEGFGFAKDQSGKYFRIPQRGRVVLEDRVEVGANCAIDRATFKETRLGEGTKLDNLIHIAHNCIIGKNGAITAGLIVAGSTHIGDNLVTGGSVRIGGHLKITDNVRLASLTAVTKNVSEPGEYGGHPIQPLKLYLKAQASVAHLPELRKKVSKILQHLGLNDSDKDHE